VRAETTLDRGERSRVRYLAALYPDLALVPLARAVRAHVQHPITEADLRLVLQARAVYNPSHHTSSIALEAIQAVGTILKRGGGLAAAARASGLSIDTVREIDRVCGIRQARRRQIRDAILEARAGGASLRAAARAVGVPLTTAHRIAGGQA
jgi:hypothetical protein